MISSLDLIKQHFGYLSVKYNFSIDKEEYFPETMGNAVVVFKSDLIGISIVVDRNQVLINIGDVSTPNREWFEFSDVVNFFKPSIKDVYIFSETMEDQMSRLAKMLLDCEPLLKGEPLRKDKIKKIEEKRVSEILENFKRDSTK